MAPENDVVALTGDCAVDIPANIVFGNDWHATVVQANGNRRFIKADGGDLEPYGSGQWFRIAYRASTTGRGS
ncbi:MAG: hypothetical protein NVS4B8_03290 [Herpetosiphon sp.]